MTTFFAPTRLCLAAVILLLAVATPMVAQAQFDTRRDSIDPESPFCQSLVGITKEDAEAGDASLQYALGQFYHRGDCVVRNEREAVRWWKLAAEQGYADAQNNLGMSYDLGNGVRRDHSEAVRWFRRAAEQGHATAQYNLAAMYATGDGVDKDYVFAHAWFVLAAVHGHPRAEHRSRSLALRMSEDQVKAAQSKAAELAQQLGAVQQ